MGIRAVFMGTPDFAVPTLLALAAQGWDVLVVTQPDKKVGRKRVLTPPPVKAAAEKLGLRVMQPVKIRDPEAIQTLVDFAPDILVTAAYGQLLPRAVLSIPRAGAINVHASLLPRWRGAAPIHRALMAGDKEAGVTIMEMVQALDAGPIVAMESIPIDDADTVLSLHDKLAELGAQMCREWLPKFIAGEVTVTPQPEDGVTYAARIERTDEFVSWHGTVDEVIRHIRGLSPWPGASTRMGELPLKIWAAAARKEVKSLAPGQVCRVGSELLVGCADGALCLLQIQPAGRRKMAALDWFSGLHQEQVQFLDGPAQ